MNIKDHKYTGHQIATGSNTQPGHLIQNQDGPNTQASSSQASDSMASDRKSNIAADRLEHLPWLNFSQKRLAISRFQTAYEQALPYAFAKQVIDGHEYLLDASRAWEDFDHSGPSGKLFSLDSHAWKTNANETTFFCFVPNAPEPLRLGTIGELENKGLGPHLLSLMLTGSSLEDDAFETEHETKMYIHESKALYVALLETGTILPKSKELALSLAASSDSEMLREANLELMTYSAGHDMFFLDLGLKMGINPDIRSKEAGCRPITWAILKGNHEAVNKLLPLTKDPGADRDFLLDLESSPKDIALLNWALNFKKPI